MMLKKKVIWVLLVSLLMNSNIILNQCNKFRQNNIEIRSFSGDKVILCSNFHDFIEIHNETELVAHPDIIGLGLVNNPYIFENLTFNLNDFSTAISISNTSSYLVVRNCNFYFTGEYQEADAFSLFDSQNVNFTNNSIYSYRSGLRIDTCNNTFLINNLISNSFQTIIVIESNNTIVKNNRLTSNYDGIYVLDSINTSIINNICYNDFTGLNIENSINTNVVNNTFKGDGIRFESSFLVSMEDFFETLQTTFIDTTNLVNNLPIYLYKNEIGLNEVNFSDAGQIILANCTNSLIKDYAFENVSDGIQLLFSEYITVKNCSFKKINNDAISLQFTDYSQINSNKIYDNYRGIYLYNSNSNNISYNLFLDDYCDVAISLEESNHNNASYNEINTNIYTQILLLYSHHNNIFGNKACVELIASNNNNVYDNECDNIPILLKWLLYLIIPIALFLSIIGFIIIKKIKNIDENRKE